MRQGLVRDADFLPPPPIQQSFVIAAGCDGLAVVSGSDVVAHRRILRVLANLKAGDELIIASLAVLPRRSGGVAAMVRNLMEAGVTIQLAMPAGESFAIAPEPQVAAVIAQVAEAEKTLRREPAPIRASGSKNPLSKYQLDYARRMQIAGESLRSIGMLFQIAPNQVWQLLNDERPQTDREPDDALSGDPLPDAGVLRLIPSYR